MRRRFYVFLSLIIADLQLAAELGKALLERNRDLESQLIHAQQIDADQQLEIEVNLDWLKSLKQFFINVPYHILVASLTLVALF